jgi:hypothetical protein
MSELLALLLNLLVAGALYMIFVHPFVVIWNLTKSPRRRR